MDAIIIGENVYKHCGLLLIHYKIDAFGFVVSGVRARYMYNYTVGWYILGLGKLAYRMVLCVLNFFNE